MMMNTYFMDVNCFATNLDFYLQDLNGTVIFETFS